MPKLKDPKEEEEFELLRMFFGLVKGLTYKEIKPISDHYDSTWELSFILDLTQKGTIKRVTRELSEIYYGKNI